jgi:hypothetical protein
MAAVTIHQAVAAVRGLFADDDIPEDFTYEGQTFDERCEAWMLQALEQLEAEIKAFEEEGESEANDEEEDEE